MTDTAIPIPEDGDRALAPRMDDLVDAIGRAFTPVARDMERVVSAVGQVWRTLVEAATMHGRVYRAMPQLTMRSVMVHGFVPYRTEPTTEMEA